VVKTKGIKVNKAETGSRFLINKDNTILDKKSGILIIQDPTLLGRLLKDYDLCGGGKGHRRSERQRLRRL